MFDDEIGKSFSLDLSDLSRETWSLLPQPGDFVAEVRTRRFDKLTYARSSGEPEDVSLFQRARKRNISIYASEAEAGEPRPVLRRGRPGRLRRARLRRSTRTFSPDREWMDGRTRLRLRVQSFALAACSR